MPKYLPFLVRNFGTNSQSLRVFGGIQSPRPQKGGKQVQLLPNMFKTPHPKKNEGNMLFSSLLLRIHMYYILAGGFKF